MSDEAELLRIAVVDITMLVATVRAFRGDETRATFAAPRKTRKRLRRELKNAVSAYLATLSHGGERSFDERRLNLCRMAAEQEMPQAIAHQNDLRAILLHEPDALDVFAPARHDLWRLTHLATHLRHGIGALRGSGTRHMVAGGRSPGKQLQKRVRRAMADYVRSLIRQAGVPGSGIVAARRMAIECLDADSLAAAAELAQAAKDANLSNQLLEDGVHRPLRDLIRDWASTSQPD